MSIRHSENYAAIPPGRTLLEIMNNRKIPFTEMAEKLKMSQEDFYNLLQGDIPLTDAIADQLEVIFDVPGTASFFKKHERGYREDLALVNRENAEQDLEELNQKYELAMALEPA